MMSSLSISKLHLLPFALLALSIGTAHAQWDYGYAPDSSLYDMFYNNDLNCSVGGNGYNSWQCHLCGPSSSWGYMAASQMPLWCAANYSNFEHYTPGFYANIKYALFNDVEVYAADPYSAIKPFSPPNLLRIQPGTNVGFTSDSTTPSFWGRLHAFYYACSDPQTAKAVNCTVRVTANMVRYYAINNKTVQDTKAATTSLRYTAKSAIQAPMTLANLTSFNMKQKKFSQTEAVYDFAVTYNIAALKKDGTPAILHMDNMAHSWWYPW